MPESVCLEANNRVPDTRASSLDVPGAQQPLETNSTKSALNIPEHDVDTRTTTAPDNPLDGAGNLEGETVLDSRPTDGATVEDGGAEPSDNSQTKRRKSEPRIMVPFTPEELDEVIKQALTIVEKECHKEEYDNGKIELWKTMLEDHIVKCVNSLDKPFKYTIFVSIQQNCGEAINVAIGGFFQADLDGYTTGHWENDDIQVDVIVMAFSVQ